MNINIRTLTGRIYRINVNITNTVCDLKAIIQQKHGIPIDKFTLVAFGKQLLNNDFLSCYNLSENSTLNLVYRMYGG